MGKDRFFTAFLVIVFTFFFLIVYIFFHNENLRMGYQIEKLRQQRDLLKEKIEILEIEKAKLTSLKKVEQTARKLGMQEIDLNKLLSIRNFEETDKDKSQKGEIGEGYFISKLGKKQ